LGQIRLETLKGIHLAHSASDTTQFFEALVAMSDSAVNAIVREDPSPHIFIQDFVPGFIIKKLCAEVPDSKCFNNVEEGGAVLPRDLLESYFWSAYDDHLRDLLIQLLPKFTPWLSEKEEYLQALGMSCKRLRPYPSFVCYANPSRGVPPHTDGESSVLTAITVFGYLSGKPAPVTNFFKPTGDAFEPITNYPPSCGSLFVWINLPRAWHGVIETISPQRLTHLVSLESYEARKT